MSGLFLLALISFFGTDRWRRYWRQLISTRYPHDICSYALIVRDDAYVASNVIGGAMAIGGTLYDATPSQTGNVARAHSYIHTMGTGSAAGWRFADGFTTSVFPIDFPTLEHLAVALAEDIQVYQGFDIVVKCSGGRWTMDDLYPLSNMGGKTGFTVLVVFNTNDHVLLGASSSGRAFTASVLAPFSEVEVEAAVGSIDGYIVARTLTMAEGAGSVRLVGNCFASGSTDMFSCPINGPNCPNSNTVVTGTPGGPVLSDECDDKKKTRKCLRKASKGKCVRRKIREVQCRYTCGACIPYGASSG